MAGRHDTNDRAHTPDDVVLGIDLGTSGVGVVAQTRDGVVVARGDHEITLRTPRPGWTEQNPADWLRAAEEAIADVIGAVGGECVVALALSGQMHGLVPLDDADEVIRPALLWNDGRTGEEVDEIHRRIGRARLVERTGNPAVTGFQLPKLLWLRRHEPEAFARTRLAMLPKDYLGLHLTGRSVAEPCDASGTGVYHLASGTWDAELLTDLDLDPGLWPTIVASDDVVGGLRGVVQSPVASPTPDPAGRIHLFAHADGTYLLLGVTLAAAGSLRWYRDTFAPGRSYAALVADAATAPVGANGVTYKPYLAGERTPHLRSDLRGSFHGLSLATSHADVVRSVLEGVAHSLREAWDVMEPLAATDRWLATGGGAVSDVWLSILADSLGAPVGRTAEQIGAAEGAATLGWLALGHRSERAARVEAWFEPDPGRAAATTEAYDRYRSLGPSES
ncbi:MAG: xylulokinase [Trueperaceae bacterium]|nr:xylulokinase [Trueperaceae bacterium]